MLVYLEHVEAYFICSALRIFAQFVPYNIYIIWHLNIPALPEKLLPPQAEPNKFQILLSSAPFMITALFFYIGYSEANVSKASPAFGVSLALQRES